MYKKKRVIILLMVLVIFSSNAQDAEALKKKIEAAQIEAAKFPAEDITGEVHKSNLGKILFASAPITEQTMNSNPAQYKNSFVLGDFIYGRAFLTKGINQHIVVSETQSVKPNYDDGTFKSYGYALMYADGKLLLDEAIDGAQPLPYLKNAKGAFVTTCEVNVVKGKSEGGSWAKFIAALNTLPTGKHNIKIEFWGSNKIRSFITTEPMATGEFVLEVKENIKAKMGVSFEGLKAGMVNKPLEAKALIAVKKYISDNGRKGDYSKVKIISTDWSIKRNKISGVITGRSIDVYGYAKWPDGSCGYMIFGINETYNGTKYIQDYSAWSLEEKKACDCIP